MKNRVHTMTPRVTQTAIRVNTLTVHDEEAQKVTVQARAPNGGSAPGFADHFEAGGRTPVLEGAVDLWATSIDTAALRDRGVSPLQARLTSFQHEGESVAPDYADAPADQAVKTATCFRPNYFSFAAQSVATDLPSGRLELRLEAGSANKWWDRQEERFSIVNHFVQSVKLTPGEDSAFADAKGVSAVLVPRFRLPDGSVEEKKDFTAVATLARLADGTFAVGEDDRLLGGHNGPWDDFTTSDTSGRTFVGFRVALVADDGAAIDNNQATGHLVDVPDLAPARG